MSAHVLTELREKCAAEKAAGWQTCASVRIDTLLALLDEVESLRGDHADVIAFVRGARLEELATAIERGEHRRKEEE